MHFPLSFLPPMIQDSSMPIRPEQRWFYPIDWHQLSAMIRFQRAKGRCEQCGRPHGRDVVRLADGRWFDKERKHWRNDTGRRARPLPVAQASRPHQLCLRTWQTRHYLHGRRAWCWRAPIWITIQVTMIRAISPPCANDATWRMIVRNTGGSVGGPCSGDARWETFSWDRIADG